MLQRLVVIILIVFLFTARSASSQDNEVLTIVRTIPQNMHLANIASLDLRTINADKAYAQYSEQLKQDISSKLKNAVELGEIDSVIVVGMYGVFVKDAASNKLSPEAAETKDIIHDSGEVALYRSTLYWISCQNRGSSNPGLIKALKSSRNNVDSNPVEASNEVLYSAWIDDGVLIVGDQREDLQTLADNYLSGIQEKVDDDLETVIRDCTDIPLWMITLNQNTVEAFKEYEETVLSVSGSSYDGPKRKEIPGAPRYFSIQYYASNSEFYEVQKIQFSRVEDAKEYVTLQKEREKELSKLSGEPSDSNYYLQGKVVIVRRVLVLDQHPEPK